MTPPRILIADDNPVTLKLFRVALEGEGDTVVTAPDGQTALDVMARTSPDLVLLDLNLPGLDGFQVCEKLRALPGGAEIPILAVSGFLPETVRARCIQVGFSDFLFKPVEPSRLLETVRSHLYVRTVRERPGRGHRILVADDDPLQRKLLKLTLEHLGFEVATAADGAEALEQARHSPPDAVVSDVLMPRVDGFGLCLSLRQDPRLTLVPVVLMSAAFTGEGDRALARKVGANTLVLRTPDCQDIVQALLASLVGGPPPLPASAVELPEADYRARLIEQLERQAIMNGHLARRCSLREVQLSLLGGISGLFARAWAGGDVLSDVLNRCLDASGASMGALWVVGQAGRLELKAQTGYQDSALRELDTFFGQAELFRRITEAGTPLVMPSAAVPEGTARDFLDRCAGRSSLVVPIALQGEPLGLLLVVSSTGALVDDDWLAFGETVAAQLGQAIALVRTSSELREARERLDHLVLANPSVIYSLNVTAEGFAPTWVSENIARVAGCEARDALTTPNWWAERIHPEDRGVVLSMLQSRQSTDDHFVHEYRFRHNDGTDRWIRDEQRIVRDPAGQPVEVVGSWSDITATKQADERARQTEKLALMGELLAGVAHELNNPLTIVTGHAALLRQMAGGGPLAQRAEKIATGAERCARIVKNFLALARQHPAERQEVRLNQVAEEAVEFLAYPLRVDNVEVRLDLAEGLPVLWADPHQLQQVIVNLVTNAHHALREAPLPRRLRLATRTDPARTRVTIEIADTGPGIPPEILERIFEPFFTTKPPGQGTGLGLAICRGIVESHRGMLRVQSEPGRGATFLIELPVEPSPATRPEASTAESPPPVRGRAILVVDDEPEIAAMLADMLSAEGHQVETAENGAVALDKLNARAYDLILCDLRMPELDGPGFWRELERQSPALLRRLIFVTGDVLSPETREFLERTAAPTVSKPFALDEVSRVVQSVLRTD